MNRAFRLIIATAVIFHSMAVYAQVEELAYDDGTPAATLQNLAPGDIEVVRFTAEHPAKLLSAHFYFAVAGGCTARIYVWGDNGGNAPDTDTVLYQTDTVVDATGWLQVDLPQDAVTIDPPWHFYVGHELQDPYCQVAWDAGSNERRSLARMGGDWYGIVDGSDPPLYLNALIRATVEYFNVIQDYDFENVTVQSGLPEGMHRMAWGDYDDDGDDDLLVSGNRLFRNNGNGTFAEVTDEAGIGGYPTNGGIWADYDNDGHLDFYATVHNYLPECENALQCVWCTLVSNPDGSRSCDEYQYDHTCEQNRCTPPDGVADHDLLWHNNGDGTFSEVSELAGAYDFLPTEGAAWGDFDNDGFVDLYVANYETPGKWAEGALSVGTPDYLWRNNGDGTFADVSEDAGIRIYDDEKCGRGVAWVDHDEDGDLDIYVSNYRLDFNFFWENQGDGTFLNISGQNGTAGVLISGQYGHTIGSTWADVDNDGDWDLFAANLAHPRFIDFSDKSMLYINSGSPDYSFSDIREQAGIAYSETHSDPAFGDYDNDGHLDLFVTDIYVGYRAFLYRSNGDLTFTDVTYPSGVVVDNGWGCAWADYDDDGKLDLVTRSLWNNQTPGTGHWLKVRLKGVNSNAAAIGAVVTVQAGALTMKRQVEGGKGTTTQNSLTLHFGLGPADSAESVVVDWPSGQQDIYQNVAADQTVTYWEGGQEPVDAGAPDATGDGTDNGGGGGCGCRLNAGQRPRDSAPGWMLLLLLAVIGLRASHWRR